MTEFLHNNKLGFDEKFFTFSIDQLPSNINLTESQIQKIMIEDVYYDNEIHELLQQVKVNELKKMKDQLCRYGYDEKGKLTGKMGGLQDDIAIGVMMLVHWAQYILARIHSSDEMYYMNLNYASNML